MDIDLALGFAGDVGLATDFLLVVARVRRDAGAGAMLKTLFTFLCTTNICDKYCSFLTAGYLCSVFCAAYLLCHTLALIHAYKSSVLNIHHVIAILSRR